MSLAVGLLWAFAPRDPAFVITYTGPTTSTAPTTTAIIPQPTLPPTTLAPPTIPVAAAGLPRPDIGRGPIPEPAPAQGLKLSTGVAAKPAIEFRSTIPIPDDLVFALAIGSDARPKEDVLRSRADSIHLIALNPRTMQGTIVGFPRDSYVQFPNGGRGKINDALARGGPNYVAETVRRLSGLPIHYVVTTGFVGFQKMVDEVGGLDIYIERRMNDRMSGARFQVGWHHLVGGEALAYSRNRHDVPYGDFSRSENQGKLLLAALSELRSEVGDDPSLLQRVEILRRWARVDVPVDQIPRLAALARHIAPERMSNVVLPGRVGMAGRASVVYLTQDAPRLFEDLRADAVIGGAQVTASTTSTPASTTSTTTASDAPTTAPTTTSTTSTTAPAASTPTTEPEVTQPESTAVPTTAVE